MANKRITELDSIGTPANDDVLEIVDVSDTTDSPEGTSKKVLVSELTSGGGSQNLQEVLNKADRPVVPLLDGDTLESLNPHYNLLQCSSLTENATLHVGINRKKI